MLQLKNMNILKLKDVILLPNILLKKDCLSENAPNSFNDKFHPSKSDNKIIIYISTKSKLTLRLKDMAKNQ